MAQLPARAPTIGQCLLRRFSATGVMIMGNLVATMVLFTGSILGIAVLVTLLVDRAGYADKDRLE
jgi:hypothetical protein